MSGLYNGAGDTFTHLHIDELVETEVSSTCIFVENVPEADFVC